MNYMPYDLKTDKFVYTYKGDPNCETATLFLKAPCFNNIQYSSKLEKLLFKAMVSSAPTAEKLQKMASEKDISIEEKEETKEEQITQVSAFIKLGDVDYMEFHNTFVEFLLKGNCFLDENYEVKLRKNMLDTMTDIDDFKNMMVEYMANFTMPSLV